MSRNWTRVLVGLSNVYLCVSHIFLMHCVRINLGFKRFTPNIFRWPLLEHFGVKPPVRLEGLMTTTPGGYDQRNQLCALPSDQCLWRKKQAWIKNDRVQVESSDLWNLETARSLTFSITQLFLGSLFKRQGFLQQFVSWEKSQYKYTLFLLKVICFEIVNISSHSLHIFYFPTLQKVRSFSFSWVFFSLFFVCIFSQCFTLLGNNGLLTDVRHGRPVTFWGKLLNMVMWGASWAVLPTSEKSENVFPMGFPSKGGMSLSPM